MGPTEAGYRGGDGVVYDPRRGRAEGQRPGGDNHKDVGRGECETASSNKHVSGRPLVRNLMKRLASLLCK